MKGKVLTKHLKTKDCSFGIVEGDAKIDSTGKFITYTGDIEIVIHFNNQIKVVRIPFEEIKPIFRNYTYEEGSLRW